MNIADSVEVESNNEPTIKPWTAPPPTVWPTPMCAPSRTCAYPLWGNGRPPRPALFCGKPAIRYSLYEQHVTRCYHAFNRAA
jgi:hypothetical protein